LEQAESAQAGQQELLGLVGKLASLEEEQLQPLTQK